MCHQRRQRPVLRCRDSGKPVVLAVEEVVVLVVEVVVVLVKGVPDNKKRRPLSRRPLVGRRREPLLLLPVLKRDSWVRVRLKRSNSNSNSAGFRTATEGRRG